MHLRIGGMTIAITSADPSLRPSVTGPAARFTVPPDGAPPDLTLTIESADVMPPPPGAPLFDSGGVWTLFEDGDRYRIDCQFDYYGNKPYEIAWFDRSFTAGRALLRGDVFGGDVDPLGYPLDEVLVSNLLARGRGVELHGCGIIEGGRGRLFVGQSGAGKTTTGRIWLARGGVEIVSDDRVIVRKIDREWRLFGTPWHGEAELSSPSSAPLDGIYLLQQAKRTRLVSLSPADTAARLFGCTFPLFYDAAALAFTLQYLDRIVAEVPVRVLEFTPDASVIDCVTSC